MNNRNNLLMLKIWILVLFFGAFVVLGIFYNLNPLFYVIFPLIVFFISFKLRQTNQNVTKALQNDNPMVLIDILVKPIKSNLQENIEESIIAYNTSFAYVLYREFEKANEIMNAVDWEAKEPMFQALDFNIKSLINFFNAEIHEGLVNARKAKELATTASVFPGAKKSMDAYEAYIEIGQILSGFSNDHNIQSLEKKFLEVPPLLKIIIAWGLVHGYKQRNKLKEFNNMLEYCRKNAPYFSRHINNFFSRLIFYYNPLRGGS